MLCKLALFTMLKVIIIIYALILFFNISSDVRGMKISREKVIVQSWGASPPPPPPQHPQELLRAVGKAIKVSFLERILCIASACFSYSSENPFLETA